MPDIEKVKKFKREILDDISAERATKEPFGIKMEIEPPRNGESILPWEKQDQVDLDLEEAPEEGLDLDFILDALDSEDQVKSAEEDGRILQDSSGVDIDSEFNDLDNDFDVLSSQLEENIERVLDDNSISLDNAANFDLDSPDSLQSLAGDLDTNLLSSDESFDKEIDAERLDNESLSDGNDALDDNFNLDDIIDNLNGSNGESDQLGMTYRGGNDFNESSEDNKNSEDPDEEGDFSNLSDDFRFLEDDKKTPSSEDNFKIDYPLFLKHLNSYPRNLRIAVAEALTRGNVSRYKIEALIDLVEQNKKGLKFIAKFSGDIVGRSVKLPVIYYKAEEFSKLEQKLSYRISKALTPILKIASIFVVLTFVSFYFLVDVMFFYIASDKKYREGISYIYENKRELAKDTFRDAYYMRPNSSWFLAYAKAFEDIRDFDSAEEKYEELFTIDPFARDASKRRRKNFDKDGYISYASMKMRLGEYSDANLILDEVISYDLYDYEALMNKGDNYFRWAQTNPKYYKDSINNYTILLSRYGHRKEILFKLFNNYIGAGAEREAKNVNTFIKTNEGLDIDEGVYTRYAKKLIDKYIDFTVYSKRINNLSKNPRYLSAQMNLLNKEFASFEAGDGKTIANALDVNLNSEIEYILRRILVKNPNYNKALFESGRYSYCMGDFKKAEGYLLTALNGFRQENSMENASDKIIAYRILADIYEKENDSLKASNIISLALNDYDFYKRNGLIKGSRELSSIYEKQGDILRSLNGFRSAISSYKMAINEGVNSPDVYYKVALLNYKENNYKDALSYLFKVENMSGFSNSNEVLNSIASVLYKMGDFVTSRSYYLRILENLETEKSSILDFRPKDNKYNKALLIKEIESYNNLGVVEIRASLGDRVGAGTVMDNRLYDSGIANLTKSSRMFDLLNRDDEMVRSVKKDLASLNLRSIFKNDFAGSNILFYESLTDNL
ncbi:hypothetical protein CR532_01675 [Candidatus Borreliella tachyglossi]|uniref:Tetratricopeptide repeat domain protein n=1 Tax=Candidatus Borreliella tachyglossi TaxID=1964448 RepID=A0A2S1LWP6_9SPIR|nr:hypothetical protein [Candidatus Borreliella tachyglossi]AWG42711.1 hypothetical protein CR532_01675 [Candidatus Borreliella tachyglossi]